MICAQDEEQWRQDTTQGEEQWRQDTTQGEEQWRQDTTQGDPADVHTTPDNNHSHALSGVSQARSRESTWLREGSTQYQIIIFQ